MTFASVEMEGWLFDVCVCTRGFMDVERVGSMALFLYWFFSCSFFFLLFYY